MKCLLYGLYGVVAFLAASILLNASSIDAAKSGDAGASKKVAAENTADATDKTETARKSQSSSDSSQQASKQARADLPKCKKNDVAQDVIAALQKPLGYDASEMKLSFTGLTEKNVDVVCENNKLTAINIYPNLVTVTAVGSYTGLCNYNIETFEGTEIDRRYHGIRNIDFDLSATVTMTLQVDKSGLVELNNANKDPFMSQLKAVNDASAKKQKCVARTSTTWEDNFFPMMDTEITSDLQFLLLTSVSDTIRQKWTSPCPSEIDMAAVFDEFANGILKINDPFEFGIKDNYDGCSITEEKAGPLSNTFITQPKVDDMVVSCTPDRKIAHVGVLQRASCQNIGKRTTDLGRTFKRTKERTQEAELKVKIDFTRNKTKDFKAEVTLLKFILKQPREKDIGKRFLILNVYVCFKDAVALSLESGLTTTNARARWV